MNVLPIQSANGDSNVPIEDLAGSKHLTEKEKIHQASQQFEAIMLQQVLSEMQKPVITSEFTDDSAAAGIYQDYISNAMAQSISKSGGFGFAKIFEQQLSPHSSAHPQTVSSVRSENETKSNGTAGQSIRSVDAPVVSGMMPASLLLQRSPSAKVHE